MKELVFLVEELPEGGFAARAESCAVFTEADTLEELRRQVCEAACCHCDECSQPESVRLRFADGREETLRP